MTRGLGWIPEVVRSLRLRQTTVAAATEADLRLHAAPGQHGRWPGRCQRGVAAATKADLRLHAALSARVTSALGTVHPDAVAIGAEAGGGLPLMGCVS